MFLDHPDYFSPTKQNSHSPKVQPPEPPLTNLSRRGFMGSTGTFVVGVALLGGCSPREKVLEDAQEASPETDNSQEVSTGDPVSLGLFAAIEPDGTVQITCHRSEMGQQTWTAMAQIIADELEADWDKMKIVQAIGHPKYGDQNTDGSRSVRRNLHRLRVAGASMRMMLEQAAATTWGVAPTECKATLGEVVHEPTGRRIGYGDLAADAGKLTLPDENTVTLKDRTDWRYIGKPNPSLTVPKIVKGEVTYGIDVDLPDMVYAVIARPPQVLGKVNTIDDSETLQTPGVLQTVNMPEGTSPAAFNPLGGVAVIASDTWAAIQGRNALDVDWAQGPNAVYNSESYAETMMETARQPGEMRRNRGDAVAAIDEAPTKVEAEYYAAHLSQAPMEPPCATARWTGDKVECWACVQAPQAARRTVAAVCGIPEDNVTINVTWLGGGFGRKSKPDFIAEAAFIAREVGRPVKVTWTREDDLRHGYYHAVSAQRLEGGLDENGNCTGFLHRSVFPPITSTFQAGEDNPSAGELELGASDTPFAVPNLRLESGRAPAHVRIGWLRSVANVYHAFAVQSFAAELAVAAGRDQKDYLLELIGEPRLIDPNTENAQYTNYGDPMEDYPIDTRRLANVTREAANLAGWGRTLPEGHGLGIASHRSFLAYVSTVVEVAVDPEGRLTIPGVWSAMDAGTVVNPRHTKAQMEGGTIYGLSNALYGEITAENGAIIQGNFPAWRVMRMNEAPRAFVTKIIDSDAPPAGVGEPATPPAAPALANAIFNATGMRVRRLPILGLENQLPLSDRQDT